MTQFNVVIVGAGHAGTQAAIALRHNKFAGSIAILGDEFELPYERPPLSKDYLAGTVNFDHLLMRPESFWSDREITLLSGKRVTSVNSDKKTVRTDDGDTIAYQKLIWATGGEPRKLSCEGNNLKGVHTLRRRADVDRIKAELDHVETAVIIGGGYIGLETAAVFIKQGKKVVLLEAQDRVLARVAGEPLSRFYEAEHRAQGVDIRLGAQMEKIIGNNGSVSGIQMANGETISCQLVVIGIGIEPAVKELLAAGAEGGNGIAVDEYCRSSLADIFAIGDCALHANPFAEGMHIRLESVQNASDQAKAVAATISGTETAYNAVPWFWSNQYDLRLQTVGLSIGYDQLVIRGEPATRSFSLVYLKGARVIALDCVNAIKDYVQGRKLIEQRICPNLEDLENPVIPLKNFEADLKNNA